MRSNYSDKELLSILKRGSSFTPSSLSPIEKEEYPNDFALFMDQMLSEYGYSRKDVAIRAGLSQDYTYKLLRGDKKTTERDYILAMCIVIGMTLAQTQHALRITGMPLLDSRDIRSHIITLAIKEEVGLDTLNDWLEESEFPYIKVSPDMPSAKIEYFQETDLSDSAPDSVQVTIKPGSPVTIEPGSYEALDSYVKAFPCGNAPFDFIYVGHMTVKNEDTRAKYHLEYDCLPDGNFCYAFNDKEYQEYQKSMPDTDPWLSPDGESTELPDIESLEAYESFEEAGSSAFFRFYVELDRMIDKKISETKDDVDDTRNYGTRFGTCSQGSHSYVYLESFNTESVAERQYLQIVENELGEVLFTASHESYFLQIEMGDLYECYFEKRRDPEYYIQVTDLNDLPERYAALKFVYRELLNSLHEFSIEHGFVKPGEAQIENDRKEVLAQRAAFLNMQGDFVGGIEVLKELAKIVESRSDKNTSDIVTLAVTYYKIFISYANLGDDENQWIWCRKTYELMPQIEALDGKDFGTESACCSVAEAALYLAQKAEFEQDFILREKYLEDTMRLLKDRCSEKESWIVYFKALVKYGFAIDSEDPEGSLSYTGKAISIARKQHLDMEDSCKMLVATLYNNHAWVLWNRLGSEEAVIYYGRAIELLEGYQEEGTVDKEKVTGLLERVGNALLKLYMESTKVNEAARLVIRLRQDGIDLIKE